MIVCCVDRDRVLWQGERPEGHALRQAEHPDGVLTALHVELDASEDCIMQRIAAAQNTELARYDVEVLLLLRR